MNLSQLALKHGSDKYGHHSYTPIYERYFEPIRNQNLTLFELGIGGYHYPNRGGASLKMWYEYFPNALIIGVDIYEKAGLNNDRTQVFRAGQDNPEFFNRLTKEVGSPDIIIDDASHINRLTIKSFEILFPLLKSGGIYVVEDCHTSYWEENYGGSTDLLNGKTTVNYFKDLTDDVNYNHIPGYEPKLREIEAIHFWEKMIFILKK